MKMIVSLTVFCIILAGLGGVYALFAAVGRSEKRRYVQALAKGEPRTSPSGSSTAEGTAESPGSSRIRIFWGFLDLSRLEALLFSADVKRPAEQFLLLMIFAGLLAFFIGFLLSKNVILSLLMMAAGIGLPLLHLMHRRRIRDEALVRQLPDALDMIVRALRVGQSVDSSLKEVSRTCPPPLGLEIQVIYEEISLGIPFNAALRNFETRFHRLPDVKLMTTAFVIQRETGGNLTRVLSNLSDLIRERYTLKRQVRSLTAEGRSSALILGALPLLVGLFFWFIRPEYISLLFHHPVGRQMVLAAVLLEITGFLSMRLMTRIDP